MLLLKSYIHESFRALINLVYPPTCAACHREVEDQNQIICQLCEDTIDVIESPVCSTCGEPLPYRNDESHRCRLLEGMIYFDKIRALLYYQDDRVRSMIHALKFGYQKRLSRDMGNYLLKGYYEFYKRYVFDAIIPVPLHKSRLKEREFNQATLIAQALHEETDIPLREDLVYRAKKTKPQSRLSIHERKNNLRNAFQAFEENRATGMNLLVVDDVFTTGATVNEVCRVLKKHGAKKVCVLTLARADLDRPIHLENVNIGEKEKHNEWPF